MKRSVSRHRRGNILLLTCLMMIAMIALIALAVDIGYLYTVRNELQRSADASAIAAAWELIEEETFDPYFSADSLTDNARATAEEFAAFNKVCNAQPGLATDDVFVGYMVDPSNPGEPVVVPPPGLLPNAVQVRVQRTDVQNGEIPLFLARVLGLDQSAGEAEATAALVQGFNGFHAPADGSNLQILPLAVDDATWSSLLSGGSGDSWRYNKDTRTVTSGGDGISELNIFPQGTGLSRQRGMVKIGGPASTTAHLAMQVSAGVTPADLDNLAAVGRSLEFDGAGELSLLGEAGISAAVKDHLIAIKGQPRMLPVFAAVAGSGDSVQYTVVKFVGVRVMDVKLAGVMTTRKVIVQPANIVAKGGIVEPGASKTEFVYSPVWLVR